LHLLRLVMSLGSGSCKVVPRLPVSFSPPHHSLDTKDVARSIVGVLELPPDSLVLHTSQGGSQTRCHTVSHMAESTM
jgi:hypothetical protein